MNRAAIYYAYQALYAEAPFIRQAEYRRRDTKLFAQLQALR